MDPVHLVTMVTTIVQHIAVRFSLYSKILPYLKLFSNIRFKILKHSFFTTKYLLRYFLIIIGIRSPNGLGFYMKNFRDKGHLID